MEAQNKSGCKNEGEHNGSKSEDWEALDTNATFTDLDAEKGKSCVRKERRGEGE